MQSNRRETMDEYPVQDAIGMPRGSLLRIDGGAGVLVHVWEGELWLTQEGSPKDHLLGAGQSFRVDRGGATLAHAFRRSVVSLSAAVPDPAQRIDLTRPGAAGRIVLHQRAGSGAADTLHRFCANLLAPITPPDSAAF
jgi:hypothetical protein